MPAFVLEIGTEELPARFLPHAEKELEERFSAALGEYGLSFSGLCACSTPRRLLVYVAELAEAAVTREELITGPPVKAAYDVGGRPTRAAEGFAKTQGVELEDTFTIDTDKGPYLAVRKVMGGGAAMDILREICPAIVASLPFPKRMRWGDGDFTFARPIRWVLALFGPEVVPFSIAEVDSGNLTHGHRVHGPGPFALANAADYFAVMEQSCAVTPKGADRRRLIREKGDNLALEKNGRVLWKDSLLDEVQGLCEHPVPILGAFDPAFLEIPRQVLLTSMESHQKSFGLEGAEGRLLPYFLTVLNIDPEEPALVKKGWERVLRARLEDARFFWKTDLGRENFETWVQALDSVIFLAPLGSMGDKSRRIAHLCGWLADTVRHSLAGQEAALSREEAVRAGRLCKADLLSEMVKEFDTLQGIMGGIYAGRFGESEHVCQGISEQYLPAGPDSPVPASLCGALVSIADKADSLAGCFGLGMIPTGAADPYALRRAALGIARIAQEKGLRFDVEALFSEAIRGYGERQWKILPEQALPRLLEFFNLRLKNHFITGGAETLLTEAVLQAGARDVWAASARLAALESFSRTPDFAESVLTFKRAANIIKKQGQDEENTLLTGCYKAGLLTDEAERALATELERMAPVFDQLWAEDRYTELFALLRKLRPFVDAFFDQVMVMCEDEELKQNRLNLLQSLVSRLGRLADFAALQI
ncbi:glycine--tRNA ligase subunit beta [Desulfovibrio sp. OttesenSCG-928-A18]|nr:glycine--tRNA ligase subunit beta [Desulfovibrio sp. OttesenSCG-928-A18]